jgi:hypothetical protein
VSARAEPSHRVGLSGFSAAAGQGWAQPAGGEHSQADQRVRVVEPERHPGDQASFVFTDSTRALDSWRSMLTSMAW